MESNPMVSPNITRLFDLSESVALVTGGAMGIGKGVAMRLSQAGAAVVILDIDTPSAQMTVDEISEMGGRAVQVLGDVSRIELVSKVFQQTLDTFGRLDILVNNAAAFPVLPSFQIDADEWDKVFDTNLKGAFFYSREAAKLMIANGNGGRIINIASIHAYKPSLYNLHYCVSKSGLVMLTKNMALEYGEHNITVNAIAPGWIETPGAERSSAEAMTVLGQSHEQVQADIAQFLNLVPLKRLGTPDDIGKVALFLASSAADYITGSVLVVDGGFLLS